MKYSAVKLLILESIAGRFCTADGMKKFIEPKIGAEINAPDLDLVLYRMCVENVVVMMNNGGFSAYFNAESVPVRFFVAGGGRVNSVYDNESVGLPVSVVTYDKKPGTLVDEIAVIPYFTEKQLAQIEDLTAQGLSNREIAGEMCIDQYLLARRARQDLPTRQAVSEGHKRLKSGDIAPKQAVAAETADQTPKPEKQIKMRPRVVDVRPFARLAASEVEKSVDEPVEKTHRLRLKRLCACGNPLGARKRECKNCWLKLNYPGQSSKSPIETTVDRRIKNFLSENKIESERVLDILLEIFLDDAPDAVKERFAVSLCDELLEASREAA